MTLQLIRVKQIHAVRTLTRSSVTECLTLIFLQTAGEAKTEKLKSFAWMSLCYCSLVITRNLAAELNTESSVISQIALD